MLNIIELVLLGVLVLLVGGRHSLLCHVLARSFSPLLSNLNIGIIRKQNIWRPDLSDVVLVISVVIYFLLKACDPEILFQKMNK